jgi:hypothetical protein
MLTLLSKYDSRLKLLHVRQKDEPSFQYDSYLGEYLKGIDFDHYSKFTSGSVNKSINQACQDEDADLLCMIHRDRGWISSLFHQSQINQELFRISMPLLILHD